MSEEKRAFRPRRPPPPSIEHFPYIEVPHKDGFRYRFTVYTGGIRCTRHTKHKDPVPMEYRELPETLKVLWGSILTTPSTPGWTGSTGKMYQPRED